MRNVDGVVREDFEVEDEVRFGGIVIGSITVRAGGSATLAGVVNGPLTVHEGGSAEVGGVLNGSATNAGGTLRIRGIVNGPVRGAEVAPGAIINGPVS
ncbi:MAG: hypothetical protein WC211_03585 [Dehalococcoidia bacterium]